MLRLSKAFLKPNSFLSHLPGIFFIAVFYIIVSYPSLYHFFVGDDFSWLRWASESDLQRLFINFIDAQGFFLRPIPKLVIFIEYNFFSLNQAYYHSVNIFLNFLVSISAYMLFLKLFKKKQIAFLSTLLFSFIPSHSQNIFWIATISTTISTLFIFLGLYFFYEARVKKSLIRYLASSLLFLFSVFSYENAVIFIFLTPLFDFFLINKKSLHAKRIILFPYILNTCIIVFYFLIRINAGAAGFSGDYNYNLTRVIPNTFGNYFGYVLLLLFSEKSLSFYNYLRVSLKSFYIVFSVFGFLTAAFFAGFFLEHREKIRLSRRTRVFLFGFLFSALSLLPYLPLGNITLRYVYLPSFGFVVMIIVLIEKAYSDYVPEDYNAVTFSSLALFLFLLCFSGLKNAEGYWKKASLISYNTYTEIKKFEAQENSNFIFYNVPIKTGEAYIFPVGLSDAVYFAQNKRNMPTFVVGDFETAKTISMQKPNSFIFWFDRGFNLKEVNL